MGLAGLPAEIILMIASCLSKESDINAFLKTNRRLYRELQKVLPLFNAQYSHATALSFAIENHFPRSVRDLLDGLKIARTRPHCLYDAHGEIIRAKRLIKAQNRQSEETEEESEESEEEYNTLGLPYNPCKTLKERRQDEHSEECKDPYWEDLYAHPLFLRGYCMVAIMHIQHALIRAIKRDHVDIVTILLQFGALPNFYRGRSRVYPRQQTGSLASDRFWRWRSWRGLDFPPLFTAVQSGNLEMAKLLLDSGADPQRYGLSNLYRAVADGRRDIISVLVKLDVRSHKYVMKLAALRNDCSMVKFLIDEGLDVAEQGHVGLYVAEMKGYEDIARLLRLRGATLFALSEDDKMNWEKEGTDGRDRGFIWQFVSIDDEVDEDDSEDDDSEVAEDQLDVNLD